MLRWWLFVAFALLLINYKLIWNQFVSLFNVLNITFYNSAVLLHILAAIIHRNRYCLLHCITHLWAFSKKYILQSLLLFFSSTWQFWSRKWRLSTDTSWTAAFHNFLRLFNQLFLLLSLQSPIFSFFSAQFQLFIGFFYSIFKILNLRP